MNVVTDVLVSALHLVEFHVLIDVVDALELVVHHVTLRVALNVLMDVIRDALNRVCNYVPTPVLVHVSANALAALLHAQNHVFIFVLLNVQEQFLPWFSTEVKIKWYNNIINYI